MKKSTKFILGVGTACAAIYGANRLFHYISTNKKLLPVTGSSIYKWTYGDIHYVKKGSGSPVLLLHHIDYYGSSYEFNLIIENLSKEHTVYAIDFPGCGRSEKRKTEYTNFLYVQMVCSFVEDIIGEKCTLVTSGNSSSVGIMSTKYQKELFDKLILINPADIYAPTPDINKQKFFKFLFELPLIGTFSYNLASNRRKTENILKKGFYNPKKCSQRLIDIYQEAAHLGDANARYLYASMAGNYLAANTIPALKDMDELTIIFGEKEMDHQKTEAHYRDFIIDIHVSYIPKTGKFPSLEAPENFANVLADVL